MIMSDLHPSAFVHENTAAAVYYAFNAKLDDPKYNQNILFLNFGSLSTKLSLIQVKNSPDNSTLPEGPFHQEVHNLLDKTYSEFSGHLIDHCFSNMVLNRHHKKQDNSD